MTSVQSTPVASVADPSSDQVVAVQESSSDLEFQSKWTFWYSTKPKGADVTFESKLKQLGSFSTLSGFKSIYTRLEKPSEMPKDSNYSLFRDELKPMWETFPKGGCWNLHIVKTTDKLSQLWEQLLFAAIGELFEEPTVAGVTVSRRTKEDVLSVWLMKPAKNIRFHVGEKFKQAFGPSALSLPIEYKDHKSCMKDKNSYHNGKFYVVPPTEEEKKKQVTE